MPERGAALIAGVERPPPVEARGARLVRGSRLMPQSKPTLPRPAPFDPQGSGYDMDRALAGGMTAAGPEAGADEGHFGSVVQTTGEEQKSLGLPADSYIILKGFNHPTFDKAVAAEEARGFRVILRGGRYYSVPK